jgi:nudix motif 8
MKAKREAAIFVPLCTVDNIPSILFTRRSKSLSSHASQISFPGGYFDESLDTSNTESADAYFNVLGNADERLVHTAVREMQEELCFDINAIQQLQRSCLQDNQQHLPFLSVLGQTQPVPNMTGNRVTPIIGQINYDLPHFSSDEFKQLFPGNLDELDWIFTVPIAQLLKEETSEPLKKWGDHDMAKTHGKYEYWGPVFPVPNVKERRDGDRIWGFTASVLRPLLHRVFKQVFVDDGNTSKL